MEYQEIVRAHLQDWNRQAEQILLSTEARRLNATSKRSWNPAARFDSFVIRASQGARERQERRIGSGTPSQTA